MEKNYCVDRFRISLEVSRVGAESYSNRISRLYRRKLHKLLGHIFARNIPAGLSIRLESPLVLKLGDIPGAFFEHVFCQRLESALEQALRQLLAEHSERWTRDTPDQCRVLLRQALRSGEESADSWLARQLALAPDIWLPILSEYALLPEGVTLYRQLRDETVRDLCRQLAPDVPQQGSVTGDSLWLCALRYFQQHPELSIPLPQLTAVPGVPPELRVVVSGGQAERYDARLLQVLFEHPVSPSLSLMSWLRALWQNPVVVERVRPALSLVRIEQLQRLLTGNDLKSQQSNRNPEPLSETLWQPVNCAGMTLLWPVLPGLFRHLGLVEGKQFVSPGGQRLASGCLLWLTTRLDVPPEDQKVSRLLCGLPLEGSVSEEDMPDDITRERLRHWMTGLPALLQSTWQKLSAEDIRQWFLLRPGWVSPEQGQTILRVQPEAFDVLLNDWPWPVNVVPLPWLDHPLTVLWTGQ